MGTVRTDNGEFKVGDLVGLSESDAKLFMANGVVEEYSDDEKSKPEPKAKTKAKTKAKKDVKPKEDKIDVPEPSMDWTRPELDEAAKKAGIENPEEFETKRQVLGAIAEKGVKKDDKTNEDN